MVALRFGNLCMDHKILYGTRANKQTKGYGYDILKSLKKRILYPQNILLQKRIGNILFGDFWI
jgi:hypothetical protein